jgi:hypothetical protein
LHPGGLVRLPPTPASVGVTSRPILASSRRGPRDTIGVDVAWRASLAFVELSDGPFQRALWSGIRGLGHLLGPRRGRVLAAAALRVSSRSERGWMRGLYRVARYTSTPTPALVQLPESWSAAAPLVRACRLGLDLDLDLRDNLQRTLFYTGTYEPGLLNFLHGELRRGDVVVDVGAHIGVHALTMARRLGRLGGGRLIAFEPAQDSAAKLRAAAARNRLAVATRGRGSARVLDRGDLHRGDRRQRQQPAAQPADAGGQVGVPDRHDVGQHQ